MLEQSFLAEGTVSQMASNQNRTCGFVKKTKVVQ